MENNPFFEAMGPKMDDGERHTLTTPFLTIQALCSEEGLVWIVYIYFFAWGSPFKSIPVPSSLVWILGGTSKNNNKNGIRPPQYPDKTLKVWYKLAGDHTLFFFFTCFSAGSSFVYILLSHESWLLGMQQVPVP